jgi:hypothetical protein
MISNSKDKADALLRKIEGLGVTFSDINFGEDWKTQPLKQGANVTVGLDLTTYPTITQFVTFIKESDLGSGKFYQFPHCLKAAFDVVTKLLFEDKDIGDKNKKVLTEKMLRVMNTLYVSSVPIANGKNVTWKEVKTSQYPAGKSSSSNVPKVVYTRAENAAMAAKRIIIKLAVKVSNWFNNNRKIMPDKLQVKTINSHSHSNMSWF